MAKQRKKTPTKSIDVPGISPEEKETLRKLGEQNSTNMSALAFRAIREYIEYLESRRNEVFCNAEKALEQELAEKPKRSPRFRALKVDFPGMRLPSDMWTDEQMESVLYAAEDESEEEG